MVRLLAAIGILCSVMASAATPPSGPDKHPLVMVLIDGARWDMLDDEDTPHLNRLTKAGAQGEVIPVWPSISSPNHWALATGLYPIHGGVYDNNMYDPSTGKNFSPAEANWGKGEPIWTTVVRQGGIAGVIAREGWAGSQMDDTRRPSFRIPYFLAEHGRDNRAQLVIDLLDQAEGTRPDLVLLYAIEVDHAQHLHGVGSPEAREAIRHADSMIGELLAGLKARGLHEEVNLMIVSDHGHIDIGPEQTVHVNDFIDTNDLVTPPLGGLMTLWPKEGRIDAVYQRIRSISPHVQVLRPEDIPARMHCCHPERAPPILLLPDPGWAVAFKGSGLLKSTHGYDNAAREMHALFIAAGPAIRPAARIPPFEIVNVYSLAASLLNVKPARNDGSIEPLCPILSQAPPGCVR